LRWFKNERVVRQVFEMDFEIIKKLKKRVDRIILMWYIVCINNKKIKGGI